MEPKVRFIAFFEEMEFIEKKGQHFPSFRMPFTTLKFDELPAQKNIAFLVVMDNLGAKKQQQIKVVLKDPKDEEILNIDGTIETNDNDNSVIGETMIAYQDDVLFKVAGIHTLLIYLNDNLVGKETFNVFIKVKANE